MVLLCTILSASPAGMIAYVAGETEAEKRVAIVDVAAGGVTRVGPGRDDGAPRWSPDGEWLAFDAQTDAGRGIYIVRFDGSEGRYLRHVRALNRDPAWSADAAQLAYVVGSGPDRQIVVYDLASNREQMWGGGRKGLMRPKWLRRSLVEALLSPDDREGPRFERIFGKADSELVGLVAAGFTAGPDTRSTDLFLVTVGDAVPFPRNVLPSDGSYVEWAAVPARRTHAIAFESDDGGDRELFLYSRRGVWDLSNHRAADWNPVWSPDGDWLAFESFRQGPRGVFRVHRDTARVYPVAVSNEASNWWPTWSPDARWLAFVSDRSGTRNLYITDVRGRETNRLTDEASGAGAPAWRPVR